MTIFDPTLQALHAAVPVAGPAALALLGGIYAAASVFSGLSGFGFSAIGCLSLLVLSPQLGIALLMSLSLLTQSASLRSLWPSLRPHVLPWSRPDGVAPYLAGGLFGMPAGTAVLSDVGARPLMVVLGIVLIGYAGWSLTRARTQRLGPAPRPLRAALLVGAAGGFIGGFSAFPGSALVVWNGLLGKGKEQGRAIVQPFILFMQVVGLLLLVATRPQLFGAAFWALLAAALLPTLAGNAIGVAIFRRTGDRGYARWTLLALGLSGAGLLLKAALA